MTNKIESAAELRQLLDLAFGAHPSLVAMAPLYYRCTVLIGAFDFLPVPTMGVAGRTIWIHEDFMRSQGGGVLLFGMVHELIHILSNLTMDTRLSFNPSVRANKAADYVINLSVQEILLPGSSRFPSIQAPDGIWLDPKYQGWIFEAVYDDLERVGGDGGLAGSIDNHMFEAPLSDKSEPFTAAEGAVVAQEMIQALSRAGREPGKGTSLGKLLHTLVQGNVDPYEVLGPALSSVLGGQGAPSFRRQRRALIHSGTYMPVPTKMFYGSVAVLADTSGSNHQGLGRALGIVLDLLQGAEIGRFALVEWGGEIVREQWLDAPARAELRNATAYEWADGGGTIVEHALGWIDEHRPDRAVIITDGEIFTPHDTRGLPITWVILPGGSADRIRGDVICLTNDPH